MNHECGEIMYTFTADIMNSL